jgi:hypothetical protein
MATCRYSDVAVKNMENTSVVTTDVNAAAVADRWSASIRFVPEHAVWAPKWLGKGNETAQKQVLQP